MLYGILYNKLLGLLFESGVQLVYRATMKKTTDDGIRYSLRSSIWKLNNEVWQMEFHQGTPCESFEP